MERPSIWVLLVVLLLGILFLREPRFQRSEEIFLRWLLRNSQSSAKPAPLTIVDVGRNGAISPLESALFLQGALEFKPTVVAIEPVLRWGERNKDQEQIFIDQAMRVPKLLLGAELTATPDLDAPVTENSAFPHVTGRRRDLVSFSGIERQPSEDLRVISTLGFYPPDEISDEMHVPLLFQYRGEVIPSFALQAALLWLRITPSEVRIDIGSVISLPNGTNIPIRSDGTMLIDPGVAMRARHITVNEILLAAQQHETTGTSTTVRLEDIRTQLVLARTESNSPDVFAAVVGAIQTNSFVRRVSWIFDCIMLLAA